MERYDYPKRKALYLLYRSGLKMQIFTEGKNKQVHTGSDSSV